MDNDKIRAAVELKKSGTCNCAQSVACAFCREAGVDYDTMWAATAAFGSGMGNMNGTCGAITGAGAVLGFAIRDRIKARAALKAVMDAFHARNAATVCRELKGIDSGVALRNCNDCVADAAEFLQQYFTEL